MREQAAGDLGRLLAQPIAHRGLHARDGNGPVENSIGAAKAAIDAGYAIECDVQLSRDGEAMVFHDAALERLTGSVGKLRDFDAAALGRLSLRGGPDRLPTLDEFLKSIGGQVPLVIEIKSDGNESLRLADRTLALLDGYEGPVAIESFDPRIILHCCKQRTPRPIGLVGPPESGQESDAALAASDFVSWSVDHLATILRRAPAIPRTTWTVRTQAHVATAAQYQAQIVFEGFLPDTVF